MTCLTVSSKGQIVLPAALRRRLGVGAGSTLLVEEEAGGLRLIVQRALPEVDVRSLAGMVTAASSGAPRRLSEFDPASMLGRNASKR